jgi:PAS domain S-box-containing protein
LLGEEQTVDETRLDQELQQLRSRAVALEQLLEVYERTVREQSDKLEQTLQSLRERAEQLAQSEAASRKQSAAMEASMDGMALLNQGGEYLYLNRAHAHVYGYDDPRELIGKTWRVLYRDDEIRRIEQEVVPLLLKNGQWRGEAIGKRRDGSTFPQEISLTMIEGGGVICVVRDITAGKELEERLRQAQKMEAVGRLAGGVAHDFNNLLMVVLGYSKLLLERLDPGDPLHRHVEEIRTAGERGSSLTRQLLTFSRKQVTQPTVLDLNTVVTSMNAMLQRLIGEDIELVTKPGQAIGRVCADPGQLEQVLMNLVVNARDAMPQGGRLTIETRAVELDEAYAREHGAIRPGPYVALVVRDTGCGMDAETQAHLFEPFFTTKGLGKGTGLGLATVYGIIVQSGGTIEVKSQPGLGTTLIVYLPLVAADTPPIADAGGAGRPPTGSETIMVVEDEAPVRRLIRDLLQRNGYTVLEASQGGEAIRLCKEYAGQIHLLLTDVVMPEMSGRELADQLSVGRPSIKVMLMSGYTDDVIVRRGVHEEGVPFLQKPFDPAVLVRAVREALDKR